MKQILAAGAALLAGACSPYDLLNASADGEGGGSRVAAVDIAYGALPRQRLDVYRPPQVVARPAPVVVFLYGGSWKRGSKARYRFAAEALAARGALVVLPDYRLYPEVRFPAFVEDAAAAVRWAHDQAANLGGDPQRIYLVGHSAGAHIAALLNLDPAWLEAAGVPREALRGVVGLAGPYAMDLDRHPLVGAVFRPEGEGDRAEPIAHADGAAAPMLLLHGGLDLTVPAGNSRALEGRLRAAGNAARTIVYDRIGHLGLVLALAPWFRHRAPVLEDVMAFVDAG